MADQVFTNQTLLDIILDTGLDLDGYTEFKILYKRPDNVEGSWPAVRVGATSEIKYAVPDRTTIPHFKDGNTWRLQSWVKAADGRDAPGGFQFVDFIKPNTLP